jgi:acetyl-CoA carboxylase biotin carboxyl carrier protein
MTQAKPRDPNSGSGGKRSVDVEHIRQLIELMVDNDLSRLELREGETHILLRRGQPIVSGPGSYAPAPLPAPLAVGHHGPASAQPAAAPTAPAENETLIRSPMVGTFYISPDPESPPFVNIGSMVDANTVVCLIEAMKVFNELKAEVSGRITKVLVKNAAAVEYDQPLFAVAPA